MRHLTAALIALSLSSLANAQTPPPADPNAETQLLKQQLELLKQRLDQLETQNAAAKAAAEKASAEAEAATKAAAEVQAAIEAPVVEAEPVEPWLLAERWQQLRMGHDESIVKGLLGRPQSVITAISGDTWVYQDEKQAQAGRGTVRFSKARGAQEWQPPVFPAGE